MIPDFPGNPNKAPKEESPKVEKAVVGEVIRRKPRVGRRFFHTFFGGDAQGVMGYVLMDVVVPAIRDVIVDTVTTAVERMVFGEGRPAGRRGSYRPGGYSSSGYTQYNRMSSPSGALGSRREEPREISRRARAHHEFDEIILATRAEAQEVIDRLFDLVGQYEQATVADLYELVGVSSNYADRSYGWTDVRGAGIVKVRDGYLLDLPQTVLLKS